MNICLGLMSKQKKELIIFSFIIKKGNEPEYIVKMSYDKSKPLTKKNLVDFLKSLDIEVKTNTKARGNNGLYQRNRIDVSRGLDEQKSIEVLIHEFAHHIHYQIDKDFNKNGEPIICYFHDYVKTDAIAHELGHAIAKLQDEYEDEDKKDRLYCDWFRNVDDDTNYKWKKLIDKGYDGGNEDNHRIGNYNGGLYRKGIYRPTFNGTMRHEKNKKESTLTPQFGPVNTYHMVASFKIRMGKELIADQHCFDDGVGYEWQHYSIDDFYEEWPPSDFDIKQSDDKEVKQ